MGKELTALFIGLLLACSGLSRDAAAQTPGPSRAYSAYEEETIRRALERVKAELDPAPEGKTVEGVSVVSFEVFEDRDPAPQALNWLHPVTQHNVVEREVLLNVGAAYSQTLSDETERNLRALGIFSVVLAVPLKGSHPKAVRYLIVTKDVWSLRIGWDARFRFLTEDAWLGWVPRPIADYVSLKPMEVNLLGSGRVAFGSLVFGRRTTTLGLGYVEPRLAGSRLRVEAQAEAIVNCATGAFEGSTGQFAYARPLFSTRARWGFETAVAWTSGLYPVSVTEQNQAGAICSATNDDLYEQPLSSGRVALLPNQYRFDRRQFQQTFVRSFGTTYKTNLSFGLEARRDAYNAGDLGLIRGQAAQDDSGALEPAEVYEAQSLYLQRLGAFQPDRRISPFFQVQAFTTQFHLDLNSETLGLQETFRLGPIATLRIYPALKAVGSNRTMLGVQASASYARAFGTGYVKLGGYNFVELASQTGTDATAGAYLRITSPRTRAGRVVSDTRVVSTYQRYFNRNVVLGGTGRLRGYQSVAAVGDNQFISNLEFRTRPLSLWSTMLGAVAFYDVGDAGRSLQRLELKQAAGVGLRFLAPQLDRDVFRLDLGFPIPKDSPRGEVTFIATFGQAFLAP